MLFVSPPSFLRKIYSSLTWHIPVTDKKVFITFDDGPVPEATPFVLDILKKHNAHATFFCIGKNVQKSPDLYARIISEGHTTGNHTYTHINGWRTKRDVYIENVEQCARQVKSNLFRPPYGKISRKQIKVLAQGYKIIMWDVLSYDFDKEVTQKECLQNVLKNVRPGSIIVFHDSVKAFNSMSYTLPIVLEKLTSLGYSFDAIPQRLKQ